MKIRPAALVVSVVLILIILASCSLPDSVCTPDSLESPELISPDWEMVSGTSPILSWSYPPACAPDEFVIQIREDGGGSETTTIPGDTSSWRVSTPLSPATQYYWHITAYMDGVEGPASESTGFWIGPVCDPATLEPPIIVDPVNMGVETSAAWQALVWEYPDMGCLPEYYLAELRPATDPTFSGPNLMDAPTSGPPFRRQVPMMLLDDCTGYVWRVRGVVGGTLGPWSEVVLFHTDYSGACGEESVYDFFPSCSSGELVSPLGISPASFSIVTDLTPTFSWDYSGLCFPGNYHVQVTTYGDYATGTIAGSTGSPVQEWTPPDDLEPATKYEWRVTGTDGSALGPYSASLRFWTGPICTTADLVAPVLELPENSHEVDTPTPTFTWSYPEACVPEAYEWFLTTDITFTTYDEHLDAGLPSSTIIIADPSTLSDCTIYLWRVRAKNSDGNGPFSEIFNFYTNFDGSCPSVAPPPPEDVACPSGHIYNPDTGSCELIDCTTITDESTCDSLTHCDWDPKSSLCTE